MIDFTIELPVGHRVTYTREHHARGLCHHLRVALKPNGTHRLPSPIDVATICEAFGMHEVAAALAKSIGWPDNASDERSAINVMEQIG